MGLRRYPKRWAFFSIHPPGPFGDFPDPSPIAIGLGYCEKFFWDVR